MEPQDSGPLGVRKPGTSDNFLAGSGVSGGAGMDPRWFRRVLGQYPTGVCVVTAAVDGTELTGMVIGSFTSVSLEPPLVAFFPSETSTTWPKIQRAGSFCVNVLGADQERTCRQFASGEGDKFAGLKYRRASSGSPILESSIAWVDCDIVSASKAGDHYVVLGRVRDLQLGRQMAPLVFYQGGYGEFSPSSLTAANIRSSLTAQLRYVDVIRPEMERLASDLGARCVASARVDADLVIAARAGSLREADSIATLVGQHVPFVPPAGAVFAAWNGGAEVKQWLSTVGHDAERETRLQSLEAVRQRGFSVGLRSDAQREFAFVLDQMASEPTGSDEVDLHPLVRRLQFDPPELSEGVRKAVRLIHAPVFDSDGVVTLCLTVYEFNRPKEGIDVYIDRLLDTASRATSLIGGKRPSADPSPG